MKYLGGSFSVGGSSAKYSEGWEEVFGKKKGEPIALNAICGKCLEEGKVYANSNGPIALCEKCRGEAK